MQDHHFESYKNYKIKHVIVITNYQDQDVASRRSEGLRDAKTW